MQFVSVWICMAKTRMSCECSQALRNYSKTDKITLFWMKIKSAQSYDHCFPSCLWLFYNRIILFRQNLQSWIYDKNTIDWLTILDLWEPLLRRRWTNLWCSYRISNKSTIWIILKIYSLSIIQRISDKSKYRSLQNRSMQNQLQIHISCR